MALSIFETFDRNGNRTLVDLGTTLNFQAMQSIQTQISIPEDNKTRNSEIVDDDNGKPEYAANRGKFFEQSAPPESGFLEGDSWMDNDDSNHLYIANKALQWVSVRDGSIFSGNWSGIIDDDGKKPDDNADVTSANTANDTSNVNGKTASDVIYNASGTLKQADDSAVDADTLPESGTKKWAGETGADVTSTNNNWSEVTDDDANKPDNNAEITYALPGDENLAGRWSFNENAGLVAYDTSGNGNNGTISTATFAAGIAGTCLTFDGASGSVLISDASAIQNIWAGGGSISTWINPDSDGENDLGRIWSKGAFLMTNAESASKVKLEFRVPHSGDNGFWQTTATAVDINVWSHVAVTYDSDALGNDPILYVNGEVVAITETQTPTGTYSTDVGTNAYIGNFSTDARTFDGEIDEAMVYNDVLTANEVKALFKWPSGTRGQGGATFGENIAGGSTANNGCSDSAVVTRFLRDRFGDGSDGNVTISGNTTLTSDMYYDDLIVDNGFTLNAAGFRIFVKGTLTNNGTISRAGNAGGNGEDAASGSHTATSGGTAGAALAAGYLNGAIAGVAGGGGAAGGVGPSAGSNGSNGNAQTNSLGGNGTNGVGGGAGGADASANPGSAGGSGGTGGTATAATSSPKTYSELVTMRNFEPASPSKFNSGAGGAGSGGGGGGHYGSVSGFAGNGGGGGGSGGSGGLMVLFARIIINSATGVISVKGGAGGDGGNGSAATGTDNGGGGGGGGGTGGSGGIMMLVYNSLTDSGSITVAGGDGGAVGALGVGTGGGVNGVAGTVGSAGTAGVKIELEI